MTASSSLKHFIWLPEHLTSLPHCCSLGFSLTSSERRAPKFSPWTSLFLGGLFCWSLSVLSTSLVAQRVKRLPTMWESWVQSLGWEDLLEKEMATHPSILAWKIPWTEEPGRLQSTGSQRVGHDYYQLIILSPAAKYILIGTTGIHTIRENSVLGRPQGVLKIKPALE